MALRTNATDGLFLRWLNVNCQCGVTVRVIVET
jgi:hypothetical protein